MAATVAKIVGALFARAPRELAAPWDNVGLIVGDPQARVRRALVCVDATPEVLAEARAQGAQLVVSHHPPFLQPLARVRADEAESAVAHEAARAGLNLCAMHTNLDYAPQGLCMELARIVGLNKVRALSPAQGSPLFKVVVFVPPTHAAQVRAAMARAGAGRIGDYEECAFASTGTGTYRPLPGAIPYAGSVGRLEQATEVRLEMLTPGSALPGVLRAMRGAHPYEEVAYDVYPLANPGPDWAGPGSPAAQSARGALGELGRSMTTGAFARRVKAALGAHQVRVSGDARRGVRLVAVGSGSAGHLVGDAAAAGAQVLLLGEIRHHEVLRARALGLAVIEAGHFATERPAVGLLCRWLKADLRGRIEVLASRTEADPFVMRQARRPTRKNM